MLEETDLMEAKMRNGDIQQTHGGGMAPNIFLFRLSTLNF